MVTHSHRYRLYTSGKLDTWSNGRCKICQRFLGLHQIKFCSKHALTRDNRSHNELQNPVKYYSFQVIRDLIGMSLPQYLSNELRVYV